MRFIVEIIVIAFAIATAAGEARSAAGDGKAPDAATGAAPSARSAEAILADSIQATGGEAPWKTHRSLETTTEIEYKKMAISATRTQTVTAKNKSLAVTKIPNVGVVSEGTNGRVVWSDDPVNGLRVLKGAEAEQFRLESTWNLERHLGKLFKKIAVKIEGAGGGRLECLELTPKVGQVLTTCYDARTHLQVLQRGTASTPQGDVPFTSKIKEWKDVQGLKLPAIVEVTTGPIDFTARLTEVAFDKALDEKIFELPKSAGKGKEKTTASAPGKGGEPFRIDADQPTTE